MRRESKDLKTTLAELELDVEAQRAYAKQLLAADPVVVVFEVRGDESESISPTMTREEFDRRAAELARLLSEWRRAR